MEANEVIRNAGRLATLARLRTAYSPVQWEIVRVAVATDDNGYLPLKTGLAYQVDGEPVITHLNRANIRSLVKSGIAEAITERQGARTIVTGMRLTKFGESIARDMMDANQAVAYEKGTK